METLDQSTNNQISERAIRNLSSSSVWVIIVSSVGIFTGLFILYTAFKLMSMPYYGSQAGGIYLILSFIWIGLHIMGLSYGIGLSKLKIFSADEFDRACAKHTAYWIFVGIVYIIWFLLFLMAIAGSGGNIFRL